MTNISNLFLDDEKQTKLTVLENTVNNTTENYDELINNPDLDERVKLRNLNSLIDSSMEVISNAMKLSVELNDIKAYELMQNILKKTNDMNMSYIRLIKPVSVKETQLVKTDSDIETDDRILLKDMKGGN